MAMHYARNMFISILVLSISIRLSSCQDGNNVMDTRTNQKENKVPRETADAPHVPDEYIAFIKVSDGVGIATESDVAFALHNIHGLEIRKTFVIGRKRALLVKGDNIKVDGLMSAIAEARGHSENPYNIALNSMEQIIPNSIIQADVLSIDNCDAQDSGADLWGLSRLSMRERESYENATYLHSDSSNGTGVDVYVVDSGIYVEHEEFESRAVWGYTASTTGEGDFDGKGHGTHVAGTIGSRTFGVAKGVNLIAIKALNSAGSGSYSSLLECLQWVYERYVTKNKRRSVINMSLGGRSTYDFGGIFKELDEAGIVVVASAGNSYDDACLHTPSFIPEVISVASSERDDSISWFSNYGTCVDIVAPGRNILSTYIGNSNATTIMSGTSMAAPHVAGVIARYMSSLPYPPSPAHVKNWLNSMATTDQLTISSWNVGTPNKLLYADCMNNTDAGITKNNNEVNDNSNTDDPITMGLSFTSTLVTSDSTESIESSTKKVHGVASNVEHSFKVLLFVICSGIVIARI